MTSQINPSNIDATYPVAGQPNNTQGFRDNFTATQTNFNYAATEITDLQNKAVLKAALTGTTLDNNMNDALLYAAKIQDFSATAVNLTTTSGPVTINYTTGHYQSLSPSTGSVTLGFTNWPASGSYGYIRLRIIVTNTAYTVTLPSPSTAAGPIAGFQGLSGNIITFAATGTYEFGFSTVDGGTTITVFDLNRPLLAAEGQTIGYQGASGTGGTVTQATNKATGVTLNKPVGQITLNNASLAAATTVNFTLTNSYIGNTDLLVLNQTSTANAGGYYFNAICNAGNAQISVRNIMAASASDAVVIRYAVVKGEIT
jgi:hypothetical protein